MNQQLSKHFSFVVAMGITGQQSCVDYIHFPLNQSHSLLSSSDTCLELICVSYTQYKVVSTHTVQCSFQGQ